MAATLGELADASHAELHGERDFVVHNIATPEQAGEGDISCFFSKAYLKHLDTTRASVVVISPEWQEQRGQRFALVHENPYFVYAVVSRFFSRYCLPRGIHETAVIDPSATLGADVSVGAHVVIEADAVVGAGCVIGSGAYIGARTILGEGCNIRPNASLLEDCELGKRVVIHSGAVIGDDGFGFAYLDEQWHHIEQLGKVVIGDNSEIGCNTTIDRGALEPTVIGENVIIDNQVQIGHNVVVGDGTAIVACTGVAGSTTIGKNCKIAGAVGIAGHIEIADGVTVTAMSRVPYSLDKANSSYSSGTNAVASGLWRRNSIRFNQLNDMAKRLKVLEQKINENATNNDET